MTDAQFEDVFNKVRTFIFIFDVPQEQRWKKYSDVVVE